MMIIFTGCDMVTAGIGMAVNAIAFFMTDIPVIGMILTLTVVRLGMGTIQRQQADADQGRDPGSSCTHHGLSRIGQSVDIRGITN